MLLNPFCLVPLIKKKAWLGSENSPQVPSLTTVTFSRKLSHWLPRPARRSATSLASFLSGNIRITMQGGWVGGWKTRNNKKRRQILLALGSFRSAVNFAVLSGGDDQLFHPRSQVARSIRSCLNDAPSFPVPTPAPSPPDDSRLQLAC